MIYQQESEKSLNSQKRADNCGVSEKEKGGPSSNMGHGVTSPGWAQIYPLFII